MGVELIESRTIRKIGVYDLPAPVIAKYELEDGIYCWQADENGINVVQCWDEPKTFEQAEPDLEQQLRELMPLFQTGKRANWSESGWKIASFARAIKKNKNREQLWKKDRKKPTR